MSCRPQPPLVWVTGAAGLIGSHLVATAPLFAPSYRVCGLRRSELDLLDRDAVARRFRVDAPHAIVHCAAMSETQACQDHPELARRANTEMTAFLAELATDIPLVFFSTDLVFDGTAARYDETSPPRPLSVYGETKWAAERVVLANPRHTVVRTSMNAGASPTGDHSFNERLRLAWQAGRTLTLFTDEYRCPIAAPLTARAVWTLLALERPGLYHLVGHECLSRWEIGQALAQRWPHLQPRLLPESIRDYIGAPRSQHLNLDNTRLQALLPFPLLGLREWLRQNPDAPL